MSALAASQRLPLKSRLGYGAGDFGFNLFFTTASLYLLYYYTDVLGLSPSTAGWVFAAALIWDALFDPAMGYIANRTRSRWGRYRPYLLFGGLPLAASWALMFLPVEFEGTALTLFAIATHMLFRTLYAVVSMPYLALSAAMTDDSKERGLLAGVRMVAAASCGLIVAFFTLELVDVFGGGREGFFRVAVIYGLLGAAIFLITFGTVREREGVAEERHPTLREMIVMLRGNTAFWIVCAAMLLGGVGATIVNKAIPYYFKYTLLREDLIGSALALGALAIVISIPIWTWVMGRTSKRFMWLCGSVLGVAAYALAWIVPAEPEAIIPVMMLLGAGGGAGYLGFWAMMPDTVEYGEWKSGVRSEGAVFGFVSLIQKASLGLAAAGLGEMLEAIGYRANVAQTPETLANLKIIMIAVPASFATAAAIAIWFYPLGPQLHGRLVRALARRRQAKTATV
jgi:glycoside/pentoside/hexuronide:cation symporter, GPH family